MPQDYEFTDYEPVRPGKSSSKTRAPQLYEDWPTANPRKFGTEGNDSKDNEELETSRVNGAEQPAKVESRGDVQKKGILARVYAHQLSLDNFARLLDRRAARAVPATS